MKAMRRIHRKR